MAVAADAAGLAFLVSAEGGEARRHGIASGTTVVSSTSSAELRQGDVDDDLHQVVALPWRRVLRRRGKREHGGGGGGGDLAWRSWRIPPSGSSSRGHVAVDVDTPEEEKKAADGAGGGSRP
ncbi:hypothetical protein ABZP36_031517 [Zizania latifolia]